ncbi:hypothetical protein Q5P01_004882 [Channa striata]|uniref:Uncharacterized protein n=1 Tax=Channa striata TaxID=64152 RepID=A0AA88NFJ0_CHASR|nr:hypothetical protein Q5P01_004882 [Channa striata]
MVTRAFPTSISSPGMFPFPSPSPPSLRKGTTILRIEEPRDVHVEGYGSSGEGGSQSMGYRGGVGAGWRGARESVKQRIRQRYAAPYEALWVACAPIILHCCTGSDVEPRGVCSARPVRLSRWKIQEELRPNLTGTTGEPGSGQVKFPAGYLQGHRIDPRCRKTLVDLGAGHG